MAKYKIESRGHRAFMTITRLADGASVFLQGDDALELGRKLEATHAAWTDQVEMRAIVVEFTGSDDADARLIAGVARHLDPGEEASAAPGEGTLAPRALRDVERRRDHSSGEPL